MSASPGFWCGWSNILTSSILGLSHHPNPPPPKGLWDGEPPERLGVAPLVPK